MPPRWGRKAVRVADLNDFATAVGGLIKGRSPVGHTHDDRYYTEAEVDAKVWYQGVLGTANEFKHVDDVPDGVVSVWSASGALDVGLPTANLGTVFTVRFGGAGRQIWRTISNSTYERSRTANVWGAWVRTDAGAAASQGHTHDDRYLGLSVDAPAGFDANTLTGEARYHVHASRNAVNMPDSGSTGDSFALESRRVSTNSTIQVALSYMTGKWFSRTRYGTGFSAWSLIAGPGLLTKAEADALYQPKGGLTVRERPGSGMKVVPLSLTLGQPTASAPVTATYRIPQRWNAPVTRWRLCATNRSVRKGDTVGTGINVDGIWVGEHAGNGAFTTAPVKAVDAFTVPDDGSVYRSGWLNAPIGGSRDVLFSYQYTATTAPVLQVAGAYTSTAKVAADTAPAGLTLAKTAALDLWIEAETYAHTPVIAALGDSLSSGAQATLPCYDSVVSIYARQHGGLPVHYAVSSDTLSDWVADPGEHKVTRWDHLPPADVCLIAMGHNDIYGLNHTAAQVQANFSVALAMVEKHVAPHAIVSTITPRNAGTAAQHTVRHEYNAWLASQVVAGTVRDLFDFDQVITGGGDTILPAYNADNIHFNTAGYLAQAGAITRPITSPANQQTAIASQIAALSYDSGRRLVPLENGWTCHEAILRRQGKDVSLYIRNMKGTDATSDVFYTLPVGFRDNAVNVAKQPTSGLYQSQINSTPMTLFSTWSGALETTERGTASSLQFLRSWTTEDPIPTSLPGSVR